MLKDFSFSDTADRVVFLLLAASWVSGIVAIVTAL